MWAKTLNGIFTINSAYKVASKLLKEAKEMDSNPRMLRQYQNASSLESYWDFREDEGDKDWEVMATNV